MKIPNENKTTRKKRLYSIIFNSTQETIVDFLLIIGIAIAVLYVMFMLW